MNKIDFQEVNNIALAHINAILGSILPDGKHEGVEYVVRNPKRADNSPGSFKINTKTGAWSDFATGDVGGDLVSLYAYVCGMNQAEAAKVIMNEYGGAHQSTEKKSQKKKRRSWTPVIPVPEHAPAPPNAHYHYGTYSLKWAYRDRNGKLLGYVCRFDRPDKDKEVLPLTYNVSEDGKKEWRWRSFESPRPMYGLERLMDLNKQVLLVEGEKCADAGHNALPDMAVLSWIGGSKSTGKIDYTQLKDREVILWPDKDKGGFEAMIDIVGRINNFVKSVHIVPPPADKPKKWDIADAIEEGWATDRLETFIRTVLTLPEKLKGGDNDNGNGNGNGSDKQESAYRDPLDDAPFRCLGFNRGMYYYLPNKVQQVAELMPNHHSSKNLISLAPLAWWWKVFPGERGPSWTAAMDALFQKNHKVGIYNAENVRGCGAWFDRGRVVLHHGDHLLVNGTRKRIHDFETDYVYEAAAATEIASAKPLTRNDARALKEMLDLVSWEQTVNGLLLAGWCVIAPICGALDWRPHVWITGGHGTGKSTIFNQIVRPILGKASLAVQSNTTEAGIRQTLGHNAYPIIFDEVEGEDPKSRQRVQTVLELMRQASSESGAVILKGTQGGKAMSFRIRSCFCFASISVQIQQSADASRISVLGLIKHHQKDRQDLYDELLEKINRTVTRSWCSGFRGRSVKLIPVIRKNVKTFARVVSELLGDQRAGDQIGTLLAGAYTLFSDNEVDSMTAQKWVASQDWSDQAESDAEPDEIRCLNQILQHFLIVNQDGRRLERSVVNLISNVAQIRNSGSSWEDDDKEVTSGDAAATLARNGIKVNIEVKELIISSSHYGIKNILADSPWPKGWGRMLKRIDGAKELSAFRFEAGIRTRAVAIPIDFIFDEDVSS